MKRIGILTSGGDAPGMNAVIRAAVRTALYRNIEPVGIVGGYKGLLDKRFEKLTLGSMANIIQRGGTILKTGRCPEFLQPQTRQIAAKNFRAENLDGLVCIGGDGSFRGAHALVTEHQIAVVGVPATIDNDMAGSDVTIGFDTAVNTALEAIDRIRDTAASHDRLFIVEVMGRDTGYLAVQVGVAGGAEHVFVPENPSNLESVIEHIKKGALRGKRSSILITAEGQKPGRAYDLAQTLRKKANLESKVCVLGHIQRGGAPTAHDRVLGSQMGSRAVEALLQSSTCSMIGWQKGEIVVIPLEQAFKEKKPVRKDLLDLIFVLSH